MVVVDDRAHLSLFLFLLLQDNILFFSSSLSPRFIINDILLLPHLAVCVLFSTLLTSLRLEINRIDLLRSFLRSVGIPDASLSFSSTTTQG
jgi:hypothetical protein